MAQSSSYDLVVIGAGPGGYVGAIRAAQLGKKVAIVEKFEHLGGTCLNVGCIPTKALLESAKTFDKLSHLDELGFSAKDVDYDWSRILGRKDKIVGDQRKGLIYLMKKNKIDVYYGHGRIASQMSVTVQREKETKTLKTKNILIATGSRVRELPFAPTTGKRIMSSDHILFIDRVPESLAIIGGGIVGMEFASMFGRFGSKVTVIEMAPRILITEDGEVVKDFQKHIAKQNVKIETGTKLTGLKETKNNVVVSVDGKADRKFDTVLVSIGRAPVTEDIGLNMVGLATDRGFIDVDGDCRTKVSNIFAIGDVLKSPALAHTASAEAIHAAEVIAGHKAEPINYESNPSAVYTYPEIASVGRTEEQLKEQKIDYKVGKFPFAPMAKAKIEGATEGFIKIIYESKYREILGVHIIGGRATELIAEFSLGRTLETTVDEIAHTIHPHPTISETVMEAAHAAMGSAIHM